MYGLLASLGGKIGAGVLAALLVGGAIWVYNARQQSIGENRAEAHHAEQVEVQTEQAKETTSKLDDERLAAVERASAKKDAFNAKLVESNRAYAAANAKLKEALAAKPQAHEVPDDTQRPEALPVVCLVPDRLVDRVDELGGMLNNLSGDRMPGTPGAAAESEAKENGPVACDALVQRIEVLTSRLGNSIAEHEELWNFSVSQYTTYAEFKNRLAKER